MLAPALLALLLAANLQSQDTVGPIRLGEPFREVVDRFGPGTPVPCKGRVNVSGGCDTIVEYSDGRDLLFLDFVPKYGLALIRITQAAGANTTIARLPPNAGKLDEWLYLDFHVFDEKAWKAAWEAHEGQQRKAKSFIGHFPASLDRNKSGLLQFTLFEE